MHQVILSAICRELNDSQLNTRSGGTKTEEAHTGEEAGWQERRKGVERRGFIIVPTAGPAWEQYVQATFGVKRNFAGPQV